MSSQSYPPLPPIPSASSASAASTVTPPLPPPLSTSSTASVGVSPLTVSPPSQSGGETSLFVGGVGFVMPFECKWSNVMPIRELIKFSAQSLGRSGNDMGPVNAVMERNMIETVGDVRLLIQENMLRTIPGLPQRLAVWLEEECSKVNIVGGGGNSVTPRASIPASSVASEVKKVSGGLMTMPPIDLRQLSSSGASTPSLIESMEQSSSKRMKVEDSSSPQSSPAGPLIFKHVSDMDTNGILYFIGTLGKTKQWTNPAEAGLVEVTCSGLMKDSVPASAIVGREAVRCVSSAELNSWFGIDLINKYVMPSHYTLRHYSSWDTECLRSWRLEGSVDGSEWITLKEHTDDTSLNAKGATHTWSIALDHLSSLVEEAAKAHAAATAAAAANVMSDNSDAGGGSVVQPIFPPPLAFRCFRVVLTAPNSNNHSYLPLSGFELYGVLHVANPSHLTQPPSAVSAPSSLRRISSVASSAASAVMSNNEPLHKEPSARFLNNVYRPHSDFDENGILYNLATAGRTKSWQNPAELGLVAVTASSIMQDSVPLTAAVGRETVRCVTKPQPDSWMCFDFGVGGDGLTIAPTHYCLRHYSSWDAEALRSWKLEGTNDVNKQDWHLLMDHSNDESLDKKGSTHTWTLPERSLEQPTAFRCFRVRQTGENSNKHFYLAVSGFELYGSVFKSDGITPQSLLGYALNTAAINQRNANPNVQPPSLSESRLTPVMEFRHSGTDFDGKGIIHFIGCDYGRRSWKNPETSSVIKVIPSSIAPDSQPMSHVVGQTVVRCVTKPEPDSWIIIDLLNSTVRPTAYSLRHYSSWDVEALRNWKFQAANDTTNWITLREHKEDTTLDAKGATGTWKLAPPPPPPNSKSPSSMPANGFRYFRILQTGLNSNKHHYLACSGFELYGSLHLSTEVLNEQKDYKSSLDSSALSSAAASSSSAARMPAPSAPSSSDAMAISPTNSVANGRLQWDEQNKGAYVRIADRQNSIIENIGSDNKWVMARSLKEYSGGKHKIAVKIVADKPTTNTWRFIVGVIPSNLDCGGARQWVGTSKSWGYIAGTGGTCHNTAKSCEYGSKYGDGDVIGIALDFIASTIEFFKNGISQGIAFQNLIGPVCIAVSMTATHSAIQFVEGWIAQPTDNDWDASVKSVALSPMVGDGSVVINSGSNDKWQSIRSVRSMSSGKHVFEVEILSAPKTANSWQMIVGVVPSTFTCSGQKQWVGAAESYGYIAGTGGKCYNEPKTVPYGEEWGMIGDVIRVVVDFDSGTIEFWKNNRSQGIAFHNLKSTVPLHAAVSLTATGSSLRLRWPLATLFS